MASARFNSPSAAALEIQPDHRLRGHQKRGSESGASPKVAASAPRAASMRPVCM